MDPDIARLIWYKRRGERAEISEEEFPEYLDPEAREQFLGAVNKLIDSFYQWNAYEPYPDFNIEVRGIPIEGKKIEGIADRSSSISFNANMLTSDKKMGVNLDFYPKSSGWGSWLSYERRIPISQIYRLGSLMNVLGEASLDYFSRPEIIVDGKTETGVEPAAFKLRSNCHNSDVERIGGIFNTVDNFITFLLKEKRSS